MHQNPLCYIPWNPDFIRRWAWKMHVFFWRSQWCLTDLHPHTFSHKLINYEIRLLLGPKIGGRNTSCHSLRFRWIMSSSRSAEVCCKIHPSTLNSSLSLVVSLLVDAVFFSGTQVFQRCQKHQHTHPATVLGTELFCGTSLPFKKEKAVKPSRGGSWSMLANPKTESTAVKFMKYPWIVLKHLFVSGKKNDTNVGSNECKRTLWVTHLKKKNSLFPQVPG